MLQLLSRTGMVVGIDPDTPYTQSALILQPGDFLLLYTDGLIDALNASGEEFGMSGVEKVLQENRHATAEEIIYLLEEAIVEHSGDITPFDDITLLLVKRL